jgi:hypothetical protein
VRRKEMGTPTFAYNVLPSKRKEGLINKSNETLPNARTNNKKTTIQAKEELYSWLFVNTIPLLVEEKKIERQTKIETWLNLYQITRELNIQKPENNNTNTPINYII